MSVEPSELMSEVWTRWQGHVVNGMFPLGRYLGCSGHSGVFLTKSAARGPLEIALKLLPTDRALAESQLPRWRRAGRLAHPHLLRLLEWGGCQLDGLPYLYAVMEYADQTLAQLLLRRALTDDEAREMLLPTLDALAFLHGRNLVQGQLKPANILVVGDQLKLASDTIRRVSEGTMSTNTPTAYDPPEARHGNSSTAADIWALGVSLFEALTRRPPSGLGEHRQAVTLPADFSPAFREVVARCLSSRPQDRPTVMELMAWARGGKSQESEPAATIQLATPAAPEPTAPGPTAAGPTAAGPTAAGPEPPRTSPPQGTSTAAPGAPSMGQSPRPRALRVVILGMVVILALGWAGERVLRALRAPAPPPPPAQVPVASLSVIPGATVPAAQPRAPVSAASTNEQGRSEVPTSPAAVREVIPEVRGSAGRTIRGHVKVWVRVIVSQDGSVFAAAADRPGPSRYFQRLAIEAAKEWTFPPADTPSPRLMQIRFDFSRDQTTARAVTLH
jgi:protein kinase-like protein